MTRDDIIRELGWDSRFCNYSELLDRIERTVRLAEAAEREACAKVCEEHETHGFHNYIGRDFAFYIRARGEA